MAANTAVLRRGVEVTISGLSTESLNNQRAWVVTACTDTPTGQRHGVWLGPGHPPMRIRRVNLTPVVLSDWPDNLEVFITEHSAKVVKKLFSDHVEKPLQAVLAMHENAADLGKQLRSETQTVPCWLSSRVQKLVRDICYSYLNHEHGFNKSLPGFYSQMQKFESKYDAKACVSFIFNSIDQIRQAFMNLLHNSDKHYDSMHDIFTLRALKNVEQYMPPDPEGVPKDYIRIDVITALCMEDFQITKLDDNYFCCAAVNVPSQDVIECKDPDERYTGSCLQILDASLTKVCAELIDTISDEMAVTFAHMEATEQSTTVFDSRVLAIVNREKKGAEWYQMEAGSCGWCFKANGVQHHNKCGGCQVELYCCRQHQKDHWPVHKKYCERLKTLRTTKENILIQRQGVNRRILDIRDRKGTLQEVICELRTLMDADELTHLIDSATLVSSTQLYNTRVSKMDNVPVGNTDFYNMCKEMEEHLILRLTEKLGELTDQSFAERPTARPGPPPVAIDLQPQRGETFSRACWIAELACKPVKPI
jgi:hypothetical protein